MARSKRRLVAFTLIAGFGPMLLACHLITGLNDYDKAECPGRDCTKPDTGTETSTDGPNNDREVPDGSKVDATGTNPVSWAHFRMPHYPDAGPPLSENAELGYNAATGGLQDKVTLLTWMQPMAPGSTNLTWAQAKDFCEKQTAAGGPWRMPSRIELVTLLDLSHGGAKFDPAFTGAQSGLHWSFSEARPAEGRRWAVDFSSGRIVKHPETSTASVRCIKGAK